MIDEAEDCIPGPRMVPSRIAVPRVPRRRPGPPPPGPLALAFDPPDPEPRRIFARIRHYRGEPGYRGVHDYFVRCPHCRAEGEFPRGVFVERIVRFDCRGCGLIFDAEVLRTMHSLRQHGR